MPLTSIDWIVIVGYLLVNLGISIYYRRRASGNTEEFFVSGREVSWWLAGTSMVATTFAADTPRPSPAWWPAPALREIGFGGDCVWAEC